ncbi:hypothetical protein PG995_007274 [Apiospora arundinis]
MNGFDEEDLTPVDLNWTNCKAHHNRSVPVFPAVQLIFDQVPIKPFGVQAVVDPRPIVSDLGQITTLHNPGKELEIWRQLETGLGVVRCEDKPFELRILMAVRGPEGVEQPAAQPNQRTAQEQEKSTATVDRATAQQYFAEQETARWDHARAVYNCGRVPPWGEFLRSREEWENLRSRLRDTVGFWLFAPEAFEAPPLGSSFGGLMETWDLSEHPPELCVFDLGP